MGHWVDRSCGEVGSTGEMPPLICQILQGRGVTTDEEAEVLFSPRLSSLANPFVLDQMEVAVQRLVTARSKGEIVGIYGDFDLDGTPAVALLKKGLEFLGFQDIQYYQPRRLREGYGFHTLGVDELKSQGVSLIITVDVGITDVKTVQYAREKNIDVIVTDHHLPKEELPEAVAIINPNKGTCPSGLTYLCGTGIAFYTVLALRKSLRESGLLENTDFDPKELLDCFAIGTITDMVPLIKENRVLVKHGLFQLERTRRPGLSALLGKLGLGGRSLSSQEVAMRFAPKLNALSRMDTDLLPLDVFLETNDLKARLLVSEVIRINERRVKLQKMAQQIAEVQVKEKKQRGYVWVWSKDFHAGVIGLVAANLAQTLGVPAFVGSINEDRQVVGSGRVPKGSSVSLLETLEFAKDTLVRFGGHNPAAGFELELKRVEDFNQKISQFYDCQESTDVYEAPFYFDARGSLGELTHQFMRWYEGLEPFGIGFEIPVIKFSDVSVDRPYVLKESHLKMWLRDHRDKVEAIWFYPPGDMLGKNLSGKFVDVLAIPQWNYFMGKKRLQLVIQDLKEVSV